MLDLSSKSLGLWAGLGTAAFLGYCIYFDNRRRSHPDFRRKLREKRKANSKGASSSGPALPDFGDQEAVQRFFLQEVQLGEELLATGDIQNGVEHLSLAVAVCGQPHSLLSVLQQTLPPQIYHLLLQNLEVAQQRVRVHASSSLMSSLMRGQGAEERGASLEIEDVE
ncbi:mitochondrial import receptor subunit TOM20 homolog B [Eurytemora carolleeae]|uniref:mitochondrial import receptor subunit TOM20 homolog B n=1 Tax=Eurytemora carolleeae TaxID=1294199 RepID=UPI000C78F924|nr:mitochondrial import receptor subunit TOM20 homolog B [Eurytemora carolleeae]|eukprot:XP_023320205.1 mitochondrial import receptor subunit TOM20 homolog B-like [Eurytemora affinis]